MGGLVWWARIQWLQGQRPMWREHDATLAALWRRDETGPHGEQTPRAAHDRLGPRGRLAGDPVTEPPDVAEPVARPI